MSRFDEALGGELAKLDAAGLRRELRRWTGRQGTAIELDGRRLTAFSSNNYLDLAGHPDVAAAAAAAFTEVGVGAGASRLISGNHAEHRQLEAELAAFHRVPAALLFNSGFQANVGVIPALVGAEDIVLSDELNHASIIDGCRLSRARVLVYRHGDADDARRLLVGERKSARRALVVTESLFSMDGDRAPLADLRALCDEQDAWLMADEAHAVGVLGPGGQGVSAETQTAQPDVLVGTLGKAFGTFGAYVAGSQPLIELLLQRARSFVFTTALPPGVAAASRAALRIAGGPDGDRRRSALRKNVEHLARGLEALAVAAASAPASHIQPLILGDERRTMAVTERLMEAGLHVQGIRPPTVPRGTSRLRISLMATHRTEDIDRLLEALGHVL